MLTSDPEMSVETVVALALASPAFLLGEIWFEAYRDDLDLDLQIERDQRGVYMLHVTVLDGMLVTGEHRMELGRLELLGPAGPAVLWLHAACLSKRAGLLQAKVTSAIAAGRT